MADLQSQFALAREYQLFSHGNMYDQRQGMKMPSEADIEHALAGGMRFDESGRPSGGFDARRSNMCPCGIARSKSGAAACGDEH
jgi:hypothetical protein